MPERSVSISARLLSNSLDMVSRSLRPLSAASAQDARSARAASSSRHSSRTAEAAAPASPPLSARAASCGTGSASRRAASASPIFPNGSMCRRVAHQKKSAVTTSARPRARERPSAMFRPSTASPSAKTSNENTAHTVRNDMTHTPSLLMPLRAKRRMSANRTFPAKHSILAEKINGNPEMGAGAPGVFPAPDLPPGLWIARPGSGSVCTLGSFSPPNPSAGE